MGNFPCDSKALVNDSSSLPCFCIDFWLNCNDNHLKIPQNFDSYRRRFVQFFSRPDSFEPFSDFFSANIKTDGDRKNIHDIPIQL